MTSGVPRHVGRVGIYLVQANKRVRRQLVPDAGRGAEASRVSVTGGRNVSIWPISKIYCAAA